MQRGDPPLASATTSSTGTRLPALNDAALPRAPVLDWASFRSTQTGGVPSAPCVEELAQVAHTTSGRAAIYQALRQLRLPAGSGVLVPTYHCPTMVAPVVRAGLVPVYFGLSADGLPDIAALDRRQGQTARAMIVAHYFGLPRSLAEIRAWCDAHGITLIEDCAHCYFGQAGERPVGGWGDFATASVSKFLPVPEAGLLGSAVRSFAPMDLQAQGIKAQLKGWVDVLEFATRHRRFAGLRPLLKTVFALKNARQKRLSSMEQQAAPSIAPSAQDAMRDCDMSRVELQPLRVSQALRERLPRARILARRCENFVAYARAFEQVRGARPLFRDPPAYAAPYVFPLWVDDAERVYRAIRTLELPVYRWDRVWPGTPQWADDTGPRWSHHVLQLLCHQDLSPADIARTARSILQLLHPSAAHAATPQAGAARSTCDDTTPGFAA